jgi:hypothetical protein
MTFHEWAIWAVILIMQNFAFTFVSRARSSGSIVRHAIASVFSNGIWFVSQIIIFTAMFQMMLGKYGLKMQVFTAVYYTVFTMIGSLTAHWFSLKTEKGKSAVGASKKYAQISVEDWATLKRHNDQMYQRYQDAQIKTAYTNLPPDLNDGKTNRTLKGWI